jgi:hypothetical protein
MCLHEHSTECYTFHMSRIFKIPHFNRWMRKSRVTDQNLVQAVREMEKGLIEADLGGGVVKKGCQ